MKKIFGWAMTAILAIAAPVALASPAAAQRLFSPGKNETDQNPAPRKLMCWNAAAQAYEVCARLPVETVVRSPAADRGASVGTSAIILIPANAARRGFSVQVQSASASCYINGQATASADFHSLLIPAGSLYETPDTHVGTGAVSIVCSAAATPVYAREW